MAYAYRRSGPTATAISNRTSWGPVSSPAHVDLPSKVFDRPLSGNFDRIFNAFERTNAFEYVRNNFEQNGKLDEKSEDRHIGHGDVVVNRKMSSSYERADCNLAAQTPSSEDEDYYREKILYSQAKQLFPLQEDLADWINKTIGVTYLNGENFLDVLDNGVALCQLAAVIHDKAKEALDQGLIVGVVPQIRGRCWQRAARRSFFSRDNTENFITFCRELGVHENLLFESDDLVIHNQPRQVILCLLEVARLATKFNIEPPGLVQLEKEIAMEERDSGLDSAMSGTGWQFRDSSPLPQTDVIPTETSPSPDLNESHLAISDNVDNESTKSGGTIESNDSDVPLKPTNELDKRVHLVTRLMERGCVCSSEKCSKLLKVKKVGEGRYNIAGRNVFIRLLKGRHMMVRVGGGWDTLEHFLSRHEPCQVRLVTQGRRGSVLPVTLPSPSPPADTSDGKRSPFTREQSISPASSKASLSGKEQSLSRTISPVDSKASSISGKISPIYKKNGSTTSATSKVSSGKSSPLQDITLSRTSTPNRPTLRTLKSALTLPLKCNLDAVDGNHTSKSSTSRNRKQSAPAIYSTPNTPTGKTLKAPVSEQRKSLPNSSINNIPKKSRSMNFTTTQKVENKKPYCGTDRLNAQARKNQSISLAATPTNEVSTPFTSRRQVRSQSLASTPDIEIKKPFCGTDKVNMHAKKTRSMSLASPIVFRPMKKCTSVLVPGAMTQAAIEESIRLSLASSIADMASNNKPFLHIKAKYRSPPPKEVPPR